jgi:NAD(P)-dependent dehydrogenase (short-subunit alcohol dehydrogenase family)
VTSPEHAILVGASKGIGRELAATFLREGADVTILSRTAPAGLDGAVHVEVDLSDLDGVSAVATALVGGRPPFRNLVFLQRMRGEADGDPMRRELTVSVEATKLLIDSLTANRPADHPGAIVIVSSLAADLVAADQPLSYHVAKAGLNAMVRYYAVQLAQNGIRVNGVTPGTVLREEARAYFRENPAEYERRIRYTPLGRMGRADEIADVISYLCSDRASFITGQVVVADGGMSLMFQGTLD